MSVHQFKGKTWGDADLVVVDYNSWQESERGLKLAETLDKDVILAEGTVHATHPLLPFSLNGY